MHQPLVTDPFALDGRGFPVRTPRAHSVADPPMTSRLADIEAHPHLYPARWTAWGEPDDFDGALVAISRRAMR